MIRVPAGRTMLQAGRVDELVPWIYLCLDIPQASWESSVRFWSAATEWDASSPWGEREQFVTLRPADGAAWLILQAIPDDVPRVHPDLVGYGRATDLARMLAAGAVPAWTWGEVEVVRSPGGLLHCSVTRPETDELRAARAGRRQLLDQICIDIPHSRWESEVEYWWEVTGREMALGAERNFITLADPDPEGGLRVLLQRLDSEDGEVSAHPDFAVADREAETARHVSLGAEVDQVLDWWTVLRAPDGLLYCLTDRDPATGHR